MTILISNRPLGWTPAFSGWEKVTSIPSKNRPGAVNLIRASGKVLSLQPPPSGEYQDRDAGADGIYEQFMPADGGTKFVSDYDAIRVLAAVTLDE